MDNTETAYCWVEVINKQLVNSNYQGENLVMWYKFLFVVWPTHDSSSLLAILAVKNSNVCLNHNTKYCPLNYWVYRYIWIELQGQGHSGQISNGHAQNFMESVIDGLHWKRVVSFVSWN